MTKKRNSKIKSSIRIKITFWAGLALVLVSIILIGFSVNTLRQSTIENSKKEAIAIAESKTGLIQNQLDLPRLAARTLAQTFSAIKDQAIPNSLSREAANGMLRKVLITNPSFLGTYTLWEPNEFDGLDAEYVRATAHDDTGRFIPYWVRDASGIIHTEALVQYEMPGVGDWYIVPRSTQKGITIAPVISQIQEQEVVTASFIEPIIHNDHFYGVAGVDAPIGFVQQLVDGVDMYNGTTNAILFTQDGTLIAVRQQPDMVNQPADLIYPDLEAFQDQLSEPLSRLSSDGKYLQIFSPLEVSEGTSRWVLGLIIPFEEITAPATSAAIRQVAISTIVIILSLIFLWLLAGQLVRPLRELTKAAESVSGGELDVYADIKSNDETEVLANAFNTMTARLREILADLEQRVAARTRDLELAAEVGQSLSLMQEIDLMLTDAVELIRERFNLYYTQVYLIDPTGRTLVLRAGTGEVGQTLLRRGHRLAVDMASLNGIAATERRTVLVQDTEHSTIHRPNPLLLDTRSEMAVPLVARGSVVGVLDVQSSQPDALNPENQAAFEALAGSLAIAIANAELFEQAETARTEIEEQARRLASSGWEDFLDAIERTERFAYTYDRHQIAPLTEDIPSHPEIELVSPIQIAGAEVGKLHFEREQGWTESERAFVDSISRQVAQQIENLRLLAQAEQYQVEAQEALRRLTREGWDAYNEQFETESGFVYLNHEVRPLSENLADFEAVHSYALKVQDETIGELNIAGIEELSEDDAELVAFINQQLSAHLENLRLSTQTELTLAQTESLYAGSEKVVQARTMKEVLFALVESTTLKDFDRVSLNIFDHPWDPQNLPEIMTMVASHVRDSETITVPEGTEYQIKEYPAASLLAQNTPTIIADLNTDPRFDETSRQYFLEVVKAKGLVSLPLVIGEHSIGGIVALQNEHLVIKEDELRQLTSLVGQAATVIQSMRLIEQTQLRAQREQALRQITAAVRGSTDPATIMRTAVRELGTALGRNTMIRFGAPEETAETTQDNGKGHSQPA